MKKSLLFLLLTFGLLLLTPKVTLAAEPKCWCVGADANCTLRSPSCPSGDAQDYEGFSVCCNEPNLYNSVFALKSPICGSSLEKSIIGCENGTFADGNTMLFVSATNSAAAKLIPFLTVKTMSILIPVVHSPITVITTARAMSMFVIPPPVVVPRAVPVSNAKIFINLIPPTLLLSTTTTLYQTINVLAFAVSPANPTTTLSVMSTPTSINTNLLVPTLPSSTSSAQLVAPMPG